MKNTVQSAAGMQEIERKFLVKGEDFKQEAFSSSHICQGYICRSSGRTVRVRIRDEKAYITIKGPSRDGGLSRFEWEKEIPVGEALELMKLSDGSVIDKTRFLVGNSDGLHTWEVDVFHGDNEGLVVAEIELGSGEEKFARPDWLGEEVTGNRLYYNSSLVSCPFKDWK